MSCCRKCDRALTINPPPGDRLSSPSPPHCVWRPCDTAEQAAPDRPITIQLGVPSARRGARRAALVQRIPWPFGR